MFFHGEFKAYIRLGGSWRRQVSPGEEVRNTVAALIDEWCERRALKALAIVLPAWPPFGHTDQWYELREALRGARARGELSAAERDKVGEALGMLDRLLTWPQPDRPV